MEQIEEQANIILTATGDIFAAPDRWTRHRMACDGDGNTVSVISPEARQYSICGAVFKSILALGEHPGQTTLYAIIEAVQGRLITAIENREGIDSCLDHLDTPPDLAIMTAWLNAWNDDMAADQAAVLGVVRTA